MLITVMLILFVPEIYGGAVVTVPMYNKVQCEQVAYEIVNHFATKPTYTCLALKWEK
jgi:hypothetical protein